MKIHRHKAFTLAEILVVMVIITFIGIAASRLNFSRLSLNEKLNIEVLKINNIFQEVKNNSLIGRGVGTQVITPDAWKIDISRVGSGQISTFYTLNNSATWIPYNLNWNSLDRIFISSLYCENLAAAKTNITGTASLIITGSNLNLVSGSCNTQSDKFLGINIKGGQRETNIKISTISGVIESN